MKIKLGGCLSSLIILLMLAVGLFLTYLMALGIVTFVDKVFGQRKAEEKIVTVDTTATEVMFEDNWDKTVPLTDDAI